MSVDQISVLSVPLVGLAAVRYEVAGFARQVEDQALAGFDDDEDDDLEEDEDEPDEEDEDAEEDEVFDDDDDL